MPAFAPSIVTGTPDYKTLSIKYIDSRGDKRSTSLRLVSGFLPASVDALIAALGAATNAYIYACSIQEHWQSNPNATSAIDAVFESLYDNVAINIKDQTSGLQQTVYIPAPVGAIVGDADVVDNNNPLYEAVRDGYELLMDGIAYTVRFTERREKNDSISAY